MLLRSSSAPILNSWLPQTKGSYSERELVPQLHRTRSLALASSFLFPAPPSDDPSKKLMIQSFFERETSKARKGCAIPRNDSTQTKNHLKEDEVLGKNQEVKTTFGSAAFAERLLSSTGLGMKVEDEEVDEGVGSSGTGIGRVSGNGGRGSTGGGGGDGVLSGFFENGNDSTDLHYQKMIEANPGNALLLGNYAKFLREVRGDLSKAEEYCGRAILTNPNDAIVLSLYAEIIWQTQKDASRAEGYFNRAIKTSPDNCYVLASYAHFLWNAEAEEEDDEGNEYNAEQSNSGPPNFLHDPSLPASY